MLTTTFRKGLSIQHWAHGLAEITAGEFAADEVQDYIFEKPILIESLAPYTFFSSKSYTRNLIFKTDFLECLVLCWDVGQSTCVHNHDHKTGWMYLAEGRLFVQNYRVAERDEVRRIGRLVPTEATELDARHGACVDKEQAIHRVSNLARYQQRAISVHVTHQAMTQCEVYSLQQGTYEIMKLSRTSEFGRLNPGVEL